jgi:hypothetical protein
LLIRQPPRGGFFVPERRPAVDENEHWHLDKRVPLAFIAAMILQTIGLVAVASAWKADVDSRLLILERSMEERKGQGDRLLIVEQQLRYIKESVDRIESSLGASKPLKN